MAAPKRLLIDGSVSRGFEPVREAFIENFTRRGELGGACCIYQDGEKVVDLWGGVRDRASGEPWREDTMVIVHSTTKAWRRRDLIKPDFDPGAESIDNPIPLVHGRDAFLPDISPDGEWVVFFEGIQQGQQEDISIIRVDGTGYRKLTDDSFEDRHPRWASDGRRIAFDSTRSGKYEVWVVNRDGSGLERLTTSSRNEEQGLYPVWAPDGAFLAYRRGQGLGSGHHGRRKRHG